jgi:hypothetical protein
MSKKLSPAARANCAKLPPVAYAFLPRQAIGERVVIIKRGESGYYSTMLDRDEMTEDEARWLVDFYNKRMGVTPAQREAMVSGSHGSFGLADADPDFYNEDGTAKIAAAVTP